jgi:hypothetical protein
MVITDCLCSNTGRWYFIKNILRFSLSLYKNSFLFFSVPDQVENLTFSNVYDTSLDISWQKPLEINGDLIGYELEWYQMNNTKSDLTDRSTVEIKPELTTYKKNNLSATTWYTISVRAKTRKGFGFKRSASIESGYPPEMPSPPTNLEVISIEKRSAVIKFSAGYTGKTNILRYIVQIQMRSNNSQWENIEVKILFQKIKYKLNFIL